MLLQKKGFLWKLNSSGAKCLFGMDSACIWDQVQMTFHVDPVLEVFVEVCLLAATPLSLQMLRSYWFFHEMTRVAKCCDRRRFPVVHVGAKSHELPPPWVLYLVVGLLWTHWQCSSSKSATWFTVRSENTGVKSLRCCVLGFAWNFRHVRDIETKEMRWDESHLSKIGGVK